MRRRTWRSTIRRAASLLVAAWALPQAGAVAQDAVTAEAAERRDNVTFEVVRLFGVEGKTLVEIYSRIPTGVLTFAEREGRWEATLAFDLQVRRGEEVVLQDAWTRTKTVSDRRMLESSRVYFVETHAFLIDPGTYELVGSIKDQAGKEVGTLQRTLEAPAESPPASDLLLATRIVADTAAAPPESYDPARKNRLVLNPNPGQVYSTGLSPLVFFYYELENRGPEPLEAVRVLRFRERATDRVVKEVRAEQIYRPGWSVDYGGVSIAGLPQGDYVLELAWEAPAGGDLPEAYRALSRRQDLVVVREQAPVAQPEMAAAEDAAGAGARPVVDHYPGLAEAQLDSVFDLLEVLMTNREKGLYKGLSPDGKRNFLNRFWAQRDPTPGSPENEFRDEVDARLTYIQTSFESPTQQGYETARGRIWLKHGKPDRRVERMLETGFSAPYEIWVFYKTGYKYAFLDEFRNRRYILLFSSDPEEQGRPDWMERLSAEAVAEIQRE